MSRLRYIALITVLVALSCSREDNLSINESVLRISPATHNQTKSLVDDTNIETKEIGIQITNPTGSNFYALNSEFGNLKLVKPVDQAWITKNGEGIKKDVVLTNDYAKIYAYYPYIPANVAGVGESAYMALDIPRQSTSGYVEDYLWGAQGTTTPGGAISINASNSSVQLKLNHSLTLVAFVIYKDGYEGAGNITKMDLMCKSGNIFRVNKESLNDLKMSLSNGVMTGGDLVSKITITDINSTIIESDPGNDKDTLLKYSNIQALLVPASFPKKEDMEFSIEVDGNIYTVALSGTDPLQIQAGIGYVIKAKLNPRMLNIVGVQEWSRVEHEVSSGYDDLWYGMQPVQIGSLLWAPVNAGYDPSHPYGLLYQWHRKYGQGFDGETPALSTIEGPTDIGNANNVINKNIFFTSQFAPYDVISPSLSSWSMSIEYNPCPAGWRVPTGGEFQSIIDSGFTYTDLGLNNLKGLWIGGNHNTDLAGSVFFPFAGYRNDSGGVSGRASSPRGMYWSTSVSGSEATLLWMSSISKFVVNSAKSRGQSVRCVKPL